MNKVNIYNLVLGSFFWGTALASTSKKAHNYADTIQYESLSHFIRTEFYRDLISQDSLCLVDIYTVQFRLDGNKLIQIDGFSPNIVNPIKLFLNKVIFYFNELPKYNKKFIDTLVAKGYTNKKMVLPIMVHLFSNNCITPINQLYNGTLSLFLDEKVEKKTGISGSYFGVKEYEAILFNTIILKSKFSYRN